MTSRGALHGADAVCTLFVAEMHATEARFPALALAYSAARLGGLVSAYWVVSPNPLSTVSLLVTLVNVSAAWAALAMPTETALAALDSPDPASHKPQPPLAAYPASVAANPRPAAPNGAAAAAAPGGYVPPSPSNPFVVDDPPLPHAAAQVGETPLPDHHATFVVEGEKTPLLT